MEHGTSRSGERWALIAILALAAILRLGWPGISEFKKDEAHIALMALDLAEGRSFPLHGIGTSVGLPKAPLSIWIYAIPFLASSNPLAGVLFTGAVNVLAVALCWWVARRYWGARAAWIAALLYATSPWALFYSRKIWEPNLMSPLALLYATTGLLGFLEGKRWAQAAHVLMLALVLQLHYHAMLVAPLTPILLLIHHRRVHVPALLAGAGLGIVTALPFLWHVLGQRSSVSPDLAAYLSRPSTLDGASLRMWWMLVTGADIHSLAGNPTYLEFLRRVPGLSLPQALTGLLAITAVAWGLWHGLRQRGDRAGGASAIVAIWSILPILVMLRHSTELYPHYFTALLPAPFLATGWLLGKVFEVTGRSATSPAGIARRLAAPLVVAIALAQAVAFIILLDVVGHQATPGGFGIPLRVLLETRQQALDWGAPVVVASPGDDARTAEWVAAYDVLLRGVPHRFVDGAHAALFPAGAATLLVAPGSEGAVATYASAGLWQSGVLIPAREGEEPFRMARWDGQAWPPWEDIPGPRALENGAELIGYGQETAVRPGQPLTWWIVWRVWKPPADRGAAYVLYAHLLDADGERIAQVDSPTTPADDWQVGDVVVQRFRFALPEEASGPFAMRVGMYAYPSLRAQPVLDQAANPLSDDLTLGPLR